MWVLLFPIAGVVIGALWFFVPRWIESWRDAQTQRHAETASDSDRQDITP